MAIAKAVSDLLIQEGNKDEPESIVKRVMTTILKDPKWTEGMNNLNSGECARKFYSELPQNIRYIREVFRQYF